MAGTELPPINPEFVAGLDVGGTKVHIMDNLTPNLHRYSTEDHANLDAILEDYFQTAQARPSRMVIGMAGPRDDETGSIELTNAPGIICNPLEASKKYSIQFSTANDMVITAAGVLQETGIDLEQLKSGIPSLTGTKLIVALSTGVGATAAIWDQRSERFVIMESEGGHIGFQPKDSSEKKYLDYLQDNSKLPHISGESAVAGKAGIDSLVDFFLPNLTGEKLITSIEFARNNKTPTGAVLFEYATQSEGADKTDAQAILRVLGGIIGSMIGDLALAFKATGGVYLTGSVASELGGYLAENTELQERFMHKGQNQRKWLEKIPVYLVTNPNVAVMGALALAKGL